MQAAHPIDIDVDRQHAITITWRDQSVSRLPLPLLRKWCPCATCRAKREEQLLAGPAEKSPARLPILSHQAPVATMVTLADVELVGHYAIRLRWTDGHDTGIYDYGYLESLGREPAPR